MAQLMAERHQQILEILQEKKFLSVVKLGEKTGASLVTIRKDLSILEEKGLVYRSHGSAGLQNPYVTDRHVSEKEKINASEKIRIAIRAASYISYGDTILLASGTTINELARQIKSPGNITVISASLIASDILSKQPETETIQLSGMVRKSSLSVVGSLAEQMLQSFSCNLLFMGVDGIDLDFGLTTTNAHEAALNRQMINASQKIIVLADSSKLGRKGFGHICPLSNVDVIITDNKASTEMVGAMEEQGIEVEMV